MTWSLAEIYRYPVKSLGEDALDTVDLMTGRALPWDRHWAIAHESAEASIKETGWKSPGNFANQTHVPRLVQTKIRFDEKSGELAVSHPDLGSITIQPGTAAGDAALAEWIAPLTDGTTKSGISGVHCAGDHAYTDFEETHISIATNNSLRALEDRLGRRLEHIRFRMNLWLEGPAPWSELEWVGREIEIGGARLKVIERDKRCNATNANPSSGKRDTQIPAFLRQTFGHMDFGVYAQVTQSGTVKRGDAARLI